MTKAFFMLVGLLLATVLAQSVHLRLGERKATPNCYSRRPLPKR